MDIAKLSTEDTHFDEPVECVLYTDAGDPETDSAGQTVALFVVSEYAKSAKRMDRVHRTRIAKLARRYGFENIPQDEMDTMAVERITACVTGWQGFESSGQPLPYSAENAVTVVRGLQKHRPKQYKNIEGAITSHADFFTTNSDA
jgi:hypothetical protein